MAITDGEGDQPGHYARWKAIWEAMLQEEREEAGARWLMACREPRAVADGEEQGGEGNGEKAGAEGGHVGSLLGKR